MAAQRKPLLITEGYNSNFSGMSRRQKFG